MILNNKKWEIWLADLNPRFGTEAGKTRPVVVFQSNFLNKTHDSTIVLPITTNVTFEAKILRVNLDEIAEETGLNEPSDILIDQIRAIDNSRFIKKIGQINDSLIRKTVIDNLKIVLDFL
jgi:mRNA interferase MazF